MWTKEGISSAAKLEWEAVYLISIFTFTFLIFTFTFIECRDEVDEGISLAAKLEWESVYLIGNGQSWKQECNQIPQLKYNINWGNLKRGKCKNQTWLNVKVLNEGKKYKYYYLNEM